MKRLILCLSLMGCAHPYKEFYKDYTEGADIESTGLFEPRPKEPEILSGSNPSSDYQSMLEEGYFLLGYVSYNGSDQNQFSAKMQGKSVKADKVVLYYEYTNTLQGSMPFQTPTSNTSYTNFSGNYGSYGQNQFSGTASTTTYGTQTTYIPYAINRYNYSGMFWGKLKPPVMGVVAHDLSNEQKSALGTGKAAYVYAVVNYSPAYQADIFAGDFIRTIDESVIDGSGTFFRVINEKSGKLVRVKITRGTKDFIKNVQLNDHPTDHASEEAGHKQVP